MEDRHAFRLGDRVNCTLCLGEFLTNGLFWKKQSENIDSIHSSSVTHSVPQKKTWCIISIQTMSTLCQYHVHVSMSISCHCIFYLQGTALWALCASWVPPTLLQVWIESKWCQMRILTLFQKSKKKKYIYIYIIYTHNNSFCSLF